PRARGIRVPGSRWRSAVAEFEEVVGRILAKEIRPVETPTEDEFDRLWRATNLGDSAPIVAAAYGGALADRLAWVFISGYQATIRRCFPDLPPVAGWSSFVNTEDPTNTLP